LTIGCFLEDDRRKIEYMHVEIIIFIKIKKSEPVHFSAVKMIIGSTKPSPSPPSPGAPSFPPPALTIVQCTSFLLHFHTYFSSSYRLPRVILHIILMKRN
jgi:hypothetical protein